MFEFFSFTSARKKYSLHFTNAQFIVACIISIACLIGSLFIYYYAEVYATESQSNAVTDIVLSNIPAMNVDGIFVYGGAIFILFCAALLLYNPEKIPFTLKSVALFVVIRSLFVSLTHIGPFPTEGIIDSPHFMRMFTTGADLFFSGHTGLPFLMALIFWDDKLLRVFFIACSLFFGAVVLLGHIHYTIDVFAAFFITYTIYHIARFLFKTDRTLFFYYKYDKRLRKFLAR